MPYRLQNQPKRTKKFREADLAREKAHNDMKRRREQKLQAKAEKERNAVIALAAKEKLENQWKSFIGSMTEKGYTKRSIATKQLKVF